jgi:tRNA (guanine-N7-)-methyltransferase
MGKKQLAHEYYQAPPYDVLLDPARFVARWERTFGREAPLHVEIAMGLGHHLVDFALAHPDMNHLGLEIKMHRIYSARQLALRQGARHIRFVPGDARRTLEALAPASVARLTLLFPDPWPRHPDRRLTAPAYLALYRRCLAPQGVLHFRTDDPDLFSFSLTSLEASGFDSEIAVPLGRTLTGFERRWLGEQRAIFGLNACAVEI